MIVGIQSGGIGKVDMSQTGGTTDKSKSKDKASGTFEDLMNLAATNPNTTTQTADSATMKNDVDAVKQADTTVSGEKKQSDLNKYTRSDAKTETTRTTGAEKAKRNEAPQEVESDDLKAELLSNKLKKLLNVDDETLQNLLQTAGLTMQDLLDPAVMKDFILQINDATSVDLLIDESLNNLMQQAMQLLDEVLNVVDETVISTEVPVEELLPEESSSAQTEPQETVVDAEKPQTVDLEDLISIGTIGLMKAINTFNTGKNIKLATYASRCIENEILMFLRRNNRIKSEVSIDEPLNQDRDGNELLLSDILGTDEDVIYKNLEDEVDHKLLKIAISKLSDKEKYIMNLRFGMNGCAEKTQKEVADLLGISQSYISRLEKRIMGKMRKEISSKTG